MSEYCKVAFKLKVLGFLTYINKAVFCSLVMKTATTLREKGGKEKQGTVKKTRECKKKRKERKEKRRDFSHAVWQPIYSTKSYALSVK